jgi:hypothetical protein
LRWPGGDSCPAKTGQDWCGFAAKTILAVMGRRQDASQALHGLARLDRSAGLLGTWRQLSNARASNDLVTGMMPTLIPIVRDIRFDIASAYIVSPSRSLGRT